MRATVLALAIGAVLCTVRPSGAATSTVRESARTIPIAYEVDVVVVGGSTAGVAAAVAAAEEGAKVFVVAPRPYLGEDACGTLRLWLEPGESLAHPLARKLFRAEVVGGLPFGYEPDAPSSGAHRDSKPPSLLRDGKWGSAASESVQYAGDVNVTVDLLKRRTFSKVHMMVYHAKDFLVESATVHSSDDRERWEPLAVMKNGNPHQVSVDVPALPLSAAVSGEARYLRFSVKAAPGAKRVLIGEIVVESDEKSAAGARPKPPPRPMHVKRLLDRALLDAGVKFLFSCYATDVLRDARGRPAGVVMANRSGRQAVVAKVIIDATDRAWVARMAGARFRPYPKGPKIFKRVVVGCQPRSVSGASARSLGFEVRSGKRSFPTTEYTLTIPMEDGGFTSFAEAEQVARNMTFHPEQVDASEVLFQVPPDPMQGAARLSGDWPGADKVDLDAFRPAGVDRLYVLGGCADMPRVVAERLLRPGALMEVGARVGGAAAAEAKQVPKPRGVRLTGKKNSADAAGDTREFLVGVRPTQEGLPAVPADERAIPVLGRYDVVVIGGGTSGAPAGIGAARRGAKTLLVEYLHGLGGVGTLGLIGKYYYGYRKGFTAEVDKGVAGIGAAVGVVGKSEWWRRENRRAGTDIWFGTLGCGAYVEKGRATGAVIATPAGRGVVMAKVVVDSTGNADIAAAAGARCSYTGGSHIAAQGTGLPPRELGASYTNTDYTFADDTDVVDSWRMFVYAREKFGGAYDLGQLVDTRERRRIAGDFVLTPLDMINRRTYPDTVVLSSSNFDSHGFTVHPVFMLQPPDRKAMRVYTPLRCLLPRDLDGMLVTGLAVSIHRDAIPVIRMQPDIQNQGYAAGVAAAMAAAGGKGTRGIDVKALQQHLVEVGSLPKSVLSDADSYPFPPAEVASAVRSFTEGDGYEGIAVILAQPEQAVALLRKAYADAVRDETRLKCAHVLGMLGDASGAPTLIEKVTEATDFGKGWNFTGMGQYGASVGFVDSLVIALGRTRDRRALRSILEKVSLLDASKEFSHHRAVALALEALGDPAAAQPLAELLAKPGMSDHAITTMEEARRWSGRGRTDTSSRNVSLRELVLARALWRCGDHRGLGEKILKRYEKDLRGHYSRHAHAVLEGGTRKPKQ